MITNRQTCKAAVLTQTNTRTHNRGRECSRACALAGTHPEESPTTIVIRRTRARTQRPPPRHKNTCTYSHKRCHARAHAHRHIYTHTPHAPTGSRCCVRTSALHRRATPLHLAAEQGKYDVVRLLVAYGADVTASHKFGSAEYSRRRGTFGFVIPFGTLPVARALGPVNTWGLYFRD